MQESIQLQRTLKTSISTGPVNQYSDTNQPQLSTYVRFFILLHFIKLFLYVFVFSTTAVLIALTTTAVNVHQIRWNFGPKDRWAVQRGQHQSLSKGCRLTIKQIDLFKCQQPLCLETHVHVNVPYYRETLGLFYVKNSIKSLQMNTLLHVCQIISNIYHLKPSFTLLPDR